MIIPERIREDMNTLTEVMALYGKNKSTIPLSFAYHLGEWWIWIDIRSRMTTYEVETHSPDLTLAIAIAVSRLRRELTHHGVRAA